MKIYLIVNSVIYLVFSVMCMFNPSSTARYLGYDFLNNSGKTEYLTVYTGMEFGFSVFLAFCAFSEASRFTGLVFCVAMYAGLMITRLVSAIAYGNISKATYIFGSTEWALGIWGIVLLITVSGNR